MNRADSIAVIVITREQHLCFSLAQIVLQSFNKWPELLKRSFVFFCKFKEHASVCHLRFKTFLALNLSFEPATFL